MKDLEFKISQFVDNELPLEEQGEFFMTLSLNEEARNMLKEYMEMKGDIKDHYGKMKGDLSGVKLTKAEQPVSKNNFKILFYFSAAAIVLILIGAGYLFSNLQILKQELSVSKNENVNIKGELDNYKKEASIFKNSVAVNNSIPEKNIAREKRINKAEEEIKHRIVPYNQRKGIDSYYSNFATVKITKDDYVLPQMAGN